MSGDRFTKLFASILDSSVWGEAHATRIVWVTLLAMANQHGEVYAALPGVARRACVTLDEANEAIECFMAPDPHSRSQEFEGRRIEPIAGGWRLLNHAHYRKLASAEDRRAKEAARKRRARQAEREAAGEFHPEPPQEYWE